MKCMDVSSTPLYVQFLVGPDADHTSGLLCIQVGHGVALLSYLIVSLALGVAREEPGELLGDDVGLGLQSGT